VLSTAQATVAAQLESADLRELLADQPRIAEHRLHRPPGHVEEWPAEFLPPGTSVANRRQRA